LLEQRLIKNNDICSKNSEKDSMSMTDIQNEIDLNNENADFKICGASVFCRGNFVFSLDTLLNYSNL
jgi:hypothetical protein